MTTDKDNTLVDYLYGELSDAEAEAFERALESDERLSADVDGLQDTLQTLRTVEAEDPSPHLDSLIFANARQAADQFAEEQKQKSLTGRLRKLFASPVAGLVAAGTVAMILAVVTVPTMMLETSETAPTSVERIPEPVVAGEQAPLQQEAKKLVERATDDENEDLPATTPAPDPEISAPLHRRDVRAEESNEKGSPSPIAPAVQPPAEARPKSKRALKKADERPRAVFDTDGLAEGVGDDRTRDTLDAKERKAPSGPPAPPPAPLDEVRPQARLEPKKDAPPMKSEASTAEVESQAYRAEEKSAKLNQPADAPTRRAKQSGELSTLADKSKAQAIVREEVAEQAQEDLAQREERGRAMLSAASAEFKRGHAEGGRQILVHALAVVRDAPIHAEIAFRLAQHDFDRGDYVEAIRYARIAASAPKFDKRNAALEIVVQAEKRRAAAPPANLDMEEARPSEPSGESR